MDNVSGGSLQNALSDAVYTMWSQIILYLPLIAVALLVVVLGWVIASVLGGVAQRLVRFTGVDDVVTKSGLNDRLRLKEGSPYRLLSGFVGSVVKWLIILVTLAMASDILNLTEVNEFIGQIIAYIPRAIVAVVILTIGVLASNFVSELISTGLSAARLPVSNQRMLASVAKYAIIVFSVMAALTQLGIVPRLIEIAFAGMVFALSLAFGLGGKDHANEWIRSLRQQM